MDEWVKGRIWWIRAPLVLLLAQQFWLRSSDAESSGVFSPLTLGLHELGHLLFGPFGMWISVAGGSIVQVAAPLASAAMFLRQPDYFAIAVCGGWFGDSLFDMAFYMSDASTLERDVVTIGGQEPIVPNDWNYLLGSVGLLLWDQRLAAAVRLCASAIYLASTIYGAIVVWRIASAPRD